MDRMRSNMILLPVLFIVLFIFLLPTQSVGEENVLGTYPKGDMPYLTFTQESMEEPFWGEVLKYKISFSENFPSDKACLTITWNEGGDKMITQYSLKNSTSDNVLLFGFLINRETQKTEFKAFFNHHSNSISFDWHDSDPNIVARYAIRLIPCGNAMLAAWGVKTLPKDAFQSFQLQTKSGKTIWQAYTNTSLDQFPNGLSLALTIDDLSKNDLKDYRPVDESMTLAAFPELKLFDQIQLSSDQCSKFREDFQRLVFLHSAYEQAQQKYLRGLIGLSEILKIKIPMLQELISMLQITKNEKINSYRSLRKQEIINDITQKIQLYEAEYDAGILPLGELNSVRDSCRKLKIEIERIK